MIMRLRKYVVKLHNCGYSIRNAENIVYDFLKNYSEKELIGFIESVEKDYLKCGKSITQIPLVAG